MVPIKNYDQFTSPVCTTQEWIPSESEAARHVLFVIISFSCRFLLFIFSYSIGKRNAHNLYLLRHVGQTPPPPPSAPLSSLLKYQEQPNLKRHCRRKSGTCWYQIQGEPKKSVAERFTRCCQPLITPIWAGGTAKQRDGSVSNSSTTGKVQIMKRGRDSEKMHCESVTLTTRSSSTVNNAQIMIPWWFLINYIYLGRYHLRADLIGECCADL